MRGFVLALLIGLVAGIWEVAARPFFPGWAALYPILPLAVLFLVSDPRVSRPLACACMGAIIVDLFFFLHSDFALIRYVGIILLLDVLAHQFLTNRSLYASLGLMIIGRFLERGTGWIFEHAVAWASGRSLLWTGWDHFWFVLGWDLLFVSLGFILMAFATRRFAGVVREGASRRLYDA